MRVMLDTNILISAIFFPSAQTRVFISEITAMHSLVLCDYVLKELRLVVERKFPKRIQKLEDFLSRLRFSLVNTLGTAESSDIPSVRDKKDTPILLAAIEHNIDVFVTGDKDFLVLAPNVSCPLIKTMAEFLLDFSVKY